MYYRVIGIHILLSILFIIVAFAVIIRSFIRHARGKQYNKTDKLLTIGYLVFMYFQLASGVLLYFFIKPRMVEGATLGEVSHNYALRFWAIEHVALMIFSLALAQIGYIFIISATGSKKYVHVGFYYGISLLVVLFSTGIALFREGIF